MLPKDFREQLFAVDQVVLIEHRSLVGKVLEVDLGKRSNNEPVYFVEVEDGTKDWFVQTHLEKIV